MARSRTTCATCGENPVSQNGNECEACQEHQRHLTALHRWARRHESPADDQGRELRVQLYAAVVAAGGAIFEKAG